jgi:hypothetical protein
MNPRAVADRLEILELVHRYGTAIDRLDMNLLDGVFVPGARIEYRVRGGGVLAFPDAKEWIARALASYEATHHVMSNSTVELAGDAARATTYVTATHVQVKLDGERSSYVLGGIYHDRLERTPSGWRIRERVLQQVYETGRSFGPRHVKSFPGPRLLPPEGAQR